MIPSAGVPQRRRLEFLGWHRKADLKVRRSSGSVGTLAVEIGALRSEFLIDVQSSELFGRRSSASI